MNNHTHILAAFVAAIIFILCGFEMLDGIMQHVSSAWVVVVDDSWVGTLFILLGSIMIVYAVINAFEIAQGIMAQLEG